MIFNPELVDDSDLVLGMFLEEACEIGEAFEVRDTLLYETYRNWCMDRGELPLRRAIFGCRFGGEDDGSPNPRVWKGIRLKETARGYSPSRYGRTPTGRKRGRSPPDRHL